MFSIINTLCETMTLTTIYTTTFIINNKKQTEYGHMSI